MAKASDLIRPVTFKNIISGEIVEGLTTPGGYARAWELCGQAKTAGRLNDMSYMQIVGLVVAYFAAKRAGIVAAKDKTTLEDVYAFADEWDVLSEEEAADESEDGEDPTSAAPEDPSAT